MKKSKLLIPLTAITTTAVVVAPMASCGGTVDPTPEVVKVEEVKFNQEYSWVEIGGTRNFGQEVKVLPDNASDKSLTWKISDQSTEAGNNVAVVDSATGIVSGKSSGYCKLTCTSKDGTLKSSEQWILVGNYKDWTNFEINAPESVIITKTDKITTTFTPSDATVSFAKFESSDPDVLTVSEYSVDGEVEIKGIAEGTATITATPYYYNSESKTVELKPSAAKTCTISVKYSDPEEIKLNTKSRIVKCGNQFVVSPTVLPITAKQDTECVIYQEEGLELVTKVSGQENTFKASDTLTGTAYITFYSTVNPKKYATCTVTVEKEYVEVTSIEITDTSPHSINIGDTWQPTVKVLPDDATNKDYYLTSSNEEVASVDATDVTKIKANSKGTATITAHSTDGIHEGSCELNVTKDVVLVNQIVLPSESYIKTGSTSRLKAQVLPRDADNKNLKWSSSETSVATIDETTGEITAISETLATTTITAAATDGSGTEATCTLTVTPNFIPIESISIPTTFEKRISQEEHSTIEANINPSTASAPYIYWESSDESIATCTWESSTSKTCTINGIKKGTCTVTAHSIDGSVISNPCTVTIEPDIPLWIILSQHEMELEVGTEDKLYSIAYPLTSDQRVKWTSSNESVATVSDGKVQAISIGTAIITCTSVADEELTATCEVEVTPKYIAVESIKLADPSQEEIEMELNQTMDLPEVKVTPEDATYPQIYWTSDNDKCLEVDNTTGKIKAINIDESSNPITLTGASIDNPELTVECHVTIQYSQPTDLKVVYAPSTLSKGQTDQIKCSIEPTTAKQSIKYESLTPEIMSVDGNTGEIKALVAGTAKIKCSCVADPSIYKTVTIAVPGQNTFVEDTWENVCKYANEGLDSLHQHYSLDCEQNKEFKGTLIGYQKKIKLNGLEHIVRVIGENHDDLADGSGKAALTFELVTLVSDSEGNRKSSAWEVSANWDYMNSVLRKNINGNGDSKSTAKFWDKNCLTLLQEDNPILYDNLKTVTKHVCTIGSGWSVKPYDDKLFPLTYTEMAQPESEQAKVEGSAYKYWTVHNDNESRIKHHYKESDVSSYWLASPWIGQFSYTYLVDWDGSINKILPGNSSSVSFAFCI